MSKIIAITVAVVVILGAGWLWYEHFAASPEWSTPQGILLPLDTTLAGTWRSTEDSKFTREFRADGTVTDLYNNASPGVSTWNVFSATNLPEKAVSFPLEPGATYLQMVDVKTGNVLDFKVVALTANELQLIYMERGNTLDFMRVRS